MRVAHKVRDVILLGLHSLRVHVVRTLLTVLSILFAVWSVIAMLAINEGVAQQAQAELAKLGSENLIIESVKPSSESSRASSGGSSRAFSYGLTDADVARLRENVPGIIRCVSVHRVSKDAVVGTKHIPVFVWGTEPEYREAANLQLTGERSRFLTHADVLRRRNVCVLTAELARKLFDYHDPLGQKVRLGSEPFVVVGIVARPAFTRSSGDGSLSADNQVFVPITANRERFGEVNWQIRQGQRSFERVQVSQLVLQMRDADAVIGGAAVARSLLGRFHQDQDYDVVVPLELIEQMKSQKRLWNLMFFVIASVSLLVGGIGIANIMLASVTERTREIGVRRALGAKKSDVVAQFLIESVMLTAVGGLLGILVGAVAVPLSVGALLKVQAVVRGLTLLIPLAMAVVVGLASGIYPAMRAAGLDPIIALRHD